MSAIIHYSTLPDPEGGRALLLKHYLPPTPGASLILFSHGLGGSRESGQDWIQPWQTLGFGVIAIQHPGTDIRELGDNIPYALLRMVRHAFQRESLLERRSDVERVIAALDGHPAIPTALQHPRSIGLCGHSFGAVTMQLVTGEARASLPPASPRDTRIRGLLTLSPSAREPEQPPGLAARFAAFDLPVLGITGTRDQGLGRSDITPENRLLPYQAMPPGDKYLLVYDGAQHRELAGEPPDAGRPSPRFRDSLRAASAAFWQASLHHNPAARRWLRHGLASTLHAQDHLEYK